MDRPRSEYWGDDNPETAREIHTTDRDTFTGLYDHRGAPLHRQPEPFGFHPHGPGSADNRKTKSKR
jgi:hypothetical protein